MLFQCSLFYSSHDKSFQVILQSKVLLCRLKGMKPFQPFKTSLESAVVSERVHNSLKRFLCVNSPPNTFVILTWHATLIPTTAVIYRGSSSARLAIITSLLKKRKFLSTSGDLMLDAGRAPVSGQSKIVIREPKFWAGRS